MVTIMDMSTGKVIREPEADEYGEEVLNAEWLPRPEPALQLGLQEVEHRREGEAALEDAERFLQAVYRYQE